MATTNVLFRRISVYPQGFSSRRFAEHIIQALPRQNLPKFYEFTHTKTGTAVYDLIRGRTLFSVDLVSPNEFNGYRDSRFRVVDGRITIPRGAINRAKSAVKSRFPRMSKRAHYYFGIRH